MHKPAMTIQEEVEADFNEQLRELGRAIARARANGAEKDTGPLEVPGRWMYRFIDKDGKTIGQTMGVEGRLA
jgi:hypothetical protein